jgi:hypothetical protein
MPENQRPPGARKARWDSNPPSRWGQEEESAVAISCSGTIGSTRPSFWPYFIRLAFGGRFLQ